MKRFFSEYPIIATCFTSCVVLLVLAMFSFTTFVFLVGKSISSISQSSKNSNKTTFDYLAGNQESKNKFLSVPIKGIILTTKDFSNPWAFLLSNYVYGYGIKNELVRAANNIDLKGIILEIDSPGGTITGAKAISDGVEYYKQKTGKPVISHISGLGASGGYWVASSTDEIMSDTGSLIGSIGVIMGPFKYYGKVLSESDFNGSITTENGIDSYNITAGIDKDLGFPYKKLSERARQALQQGVDNEYDIFVEHVSQKRHLDPNQIRNKIGALAYDNKQALQFGLIDRIGNKDEAYLRLSDIAAVDNTDFQIVTEQKSDFWSEVFKTVLLNAGGYKAQSSNQSNKCPLCGEMLFLYGDPEKR